MKAKKKKNISILITITHKLPSTEVFFFIVKQFQKTSQRKRVVGSVLKRFLKNALILQYFSTYLCYLANT